MTPTTGDLAYIARGMPCCGNLGQMHFGEIGKVDSIICGNGYCKACGHAYKTAETYANFNKGYILLSCLERIPPLAELEETVVAALVECPA